jgi:hypothetical protein
LRSLLEGQQIALLLFESPNLSVNAVLLISDHQFQLLIFAQQLGNGAFLGSLFAREDLLEAIEESILWHDSF